VAILNNDSDAPVNNSSSTGLGVNNVPQVQTVSDLRQITDSCVSTDAVTRYALTRFPFLPFTIRFNRPNVNISQIKSDLLAHVSDVHRLEMNIIGSRRSKANCGDNQFDLLIYVEET
jgi:hypothetical protein